MRSKHPDAFAFTAAILLLVAMMIGWWFGAGVGEHRANWPHADYSYECGKPMKDAAKLFYDTVDVKHFRSFTLTYTCP